MSEAPGPKKKRSRARPKAASEPNPSDAALPEPNVPRSFKTAAEIGAAQALAGLKKPAEIAAAQALAGLKKPAEIAAAHALAGLKTPLATSAATMAAEALKTPNAAFRSRIQEDLAKTLASDALLRERTQAWTDIRSKLSRTISTADASNSRLTNLLSTYRDEGSEPLVIRDPNKAVEREVRNVAGLLREQNEGIKTTAQLLQTMVDISQQQGIENALARQDASREAKAIKRLTAALVGLTLALLLFTVVIAILTWGLYAKEAAPAETPAAAAPISRS